MQYSIVKELTLISQLGLGEVRLIDRAADGDARGAGVDEGGGDGGGGQSGDEGMSRFWFVFLGGEGQLCRLEGWLEVLCWIDGEWRV